MSEEDAEIALLHKLQAGQENTAWDDGADGAEGIASESENSDQKVKEEENISDDHVLRASPQSHTDALSDSDTYNPLSPSSQTAVTDIALEDSKSPSRASSRKPKTIGGFLADDSDSDNDDARASLATDKVSAAEHLQVPSVDATSRLTSRSPLNESSSLQAPEGVATLDRASVGPDASNPTGMSSTGNHSLSTQIMANIDQVSRALPAAASNMSTLTADYDTARLPHDTAGILEDRIKEDPRGDLEAWLALISEHQHRNKLDDARMVYDRFLRVFPSAADIWVAYAEMELQNDNFYAAEQIFGKSLLTVPNVQLWSVYLNYIRRRNDFTNDVSGTARATVSQAYDFVLDNVGFDRDSGLIWQEYVHFIRGGPGQIGGNSWQDQQKMDRLRKAYQRAICVPMSTVNVLWKEYDQFEMGLNKMTGRKFLQERSPAYMSARSANTAIENITRGLVRTNLPRLPPALGFDGDQEYMQQVTLWKKWIQWEHEDPLALKPDEAEAYKQRNLFVYKQATMALRFWPESWVEAADWCYAAGLEKEGSEFLSQGIAANPESCLLAFKFGDRLESVLPVEEGDEGIASRGAAIKAPYNKVLDALYELAKVVKTRETRDIARIESSASMEAAIEAAAQEAEDDEDDVDRGNKDIKSAQQASHLQAIKQGYEMQMRLISRTISFSWIALMRAMRRVQGKGKINAVVGGSRQIFNDARLRGRITSDVYVASALIEHHVYKDPVGTKIFERGAKLFPEDEIFISEYLKHLLSIGDTTNARAVFETSVNRLSQKPDLVAKTKPLYIQFHKYESDYGDLSQIKKLEQRMLDLFPEDPKLLRFSSRYSSDGFDPTAVRSIISPMTQMRPKAIMQSIETAQSVQNSPRPQYRQENSPRPTYLQVNNSPKRPFGGDESDSELNRPRKLARGESPLKGAAGRRLDQQKRLQQTHGTPSWQANAPAPAPIPRDITFLLSIIPRADLYNATRFVPEAMVKLVAQTHIPDYGAWKASRDQSARFENGFHYGR